jgi:hypothetical protein
VNYLQPQNAGQIEFIDLFGFGEPAQCAAAVGFQDIASPRMQVWSLNHSSTMRAFSAEECAAKSP